MSFGVDRTCSALRLVPRTALTLSESYPSEAVNDDWWGLTEDNLRTTEASHTRDGKTWLVSVPYAQITLLGTISQQLLTT